jgi:hypothetical protein
MKKTNRPWMQTASGGKFHLSKSEPAEVDIKDIAEALAKISRFNGHTQNFYSIAQHSCLVMDVLPLAAKPYGLMQDAHKAFTGEMMRPVRAALAQEAGYDIWARVCLDVQKAVHESVGLTWPPHPTLAKLVEEADRKILATERRDILADGPSWQMSLPAPDKQVIRAWTWVESHHNFLERFRQVCKYRPDIVLALKYFGRGEIGA